VDAQNQLIFPCSMHFYWSGIAARCSPCVQ
jgi:hypothetical protein